MAVNLDTITMDRIQIYDRADFAMNITCYDSGGSAIDWTNYTLDSGMSHYYGGTPVIEDFVTGNASGVLTFYITESDFIDFYDPASFADLAAKHERIKGVIVVTADDTTTKSRIFESEFVILPQTRDKSFWLGGRLI